MPGMSILTNVSSLTAQANSTRNAREMQSSIGRLSSGLRIRSAADDAAGLAVSENMRAQMRGFQQALRNTNDAVSMLQTAESGYQSISDVIVRMRELAVQASNDSLSDTERGYLDTEFQDLLSEVGRISNTVEYNGQSLLDGTAGNGSGLLTFQVGARGTADDRLTVTLADNDATALGINSEAVDSLANAQGSIAALDTALDSLNDDRATVGATINQLTSAADHLGSTIENVGASLSQIRDVDMAQESANFATQKVLQEAAVAMLAQANAAPQLALRLLG